MSGETQGDTYELKDGFFPLRKPTSLQRVVWDPDSDRVAHRQQAPAPSAPVTARLWSKGQGQHPGWDTGWPLYTKGVWTSLSKIILIHFHLPKM